MKIDIKNFDFSKVLCNVRSGYNLNSLNQLSIKYSGISEKIKDVANYLYLSSHEDEKNIDIDKYNDLEHQLLSQEALLALGRNDFESVRKYIGNITKITQDTLMTYCKMIGICVENINNKTAKLNKIIPYSNNYNTISYNRIVEIIKNASKDLFEEVSKVSNIIKKEQIIPVFNE